MKKTHIRHINYFMLIFPLLFFFARPNEFGRETEFFHGYSITKPAIKIGLGVGLTDIVIRSSSGMKIYQVDKDYKLLGQDEAEAQIKGHKEALTEKFSVQISRARTREEAERAVQELEAKVEHKISIAPTAEGGPLGAWQLLVGDFLTRGDALHFVSRLEGLGIKDVWIVRTEVTEKDSRPFGLLLGKQLIDLDGETVLYFIPSNSQSYLYYNDKAYRGIFIVRHSARGIVLINTLNVDDYLQGVVPCEMSAYEFGEIEAQKAQAVAARTYALKNIGRYKDLGFDLDDSPSSQVYKGLDAETAPSTRAVRETIGQVALYKDNLIDALYTSTCGGMTEDVENIFPGPALPYLKGVECTEEREEEWIIKSGRIPQPVIWNGQDVGRKIAALTALGIISQPIDPAYYRVPVEAEEAEGWTLGLLSRLGRKAETQVLGRDQKTWSHAELASWLVKQLGWQERVKNLLLQSEADHVLKDFPEIKGPERNDLAYMIISGVFPLLAKSGGAEPPVSRAELGSILYKVLVLHQPVFEQGILKRVDKDRLVLIQSGEEKTYTLSPDPLLMRSLEGVSSFAGRLDLEGGERANFIQADGQVRLLEVDYTSPSNVLDRSSALHRWQVRMSRRELETRINQFYPLGHLIDIVPKARGVSKRVIELEIVGSEGREIVRGLKIRWALGLRENSFVVDKEVDEQGQAAYFSFSGRGWGHGVGLCQVGAFRLAQIGHTYKDILKKYYRGITINKVY